MLLSSITCFFPFFNICDLLFGTFFQKEEEEEEEAGLKIWHLLLQGYC